MEVLIWFSLISLWWIISLTVLLPFVILLKYNRYFRDLWFSFMYTKFLKLLDNQMTPLRKKQFQLLNENLSGRDVTKPLKVLEIGIGPGPNLQFYPDNSHLTALDRNANFDSYFKQNRQKYPHIVYERTLISYAENMKDVDDCSMDLVISTYVLCSVTNMKKALKEIKRVLKPGGKYVFLDHVCYPKSEWGYTIQKFALPLWYIYSSHCNLMRNVEDAIMNAEFSDVDYKNMYPKQFILITRPHTIGIATK